MRILQVGKYYPPRWGGMETALKDICEAISAHVDVEAIVANERARTERDLQEGVPVTRLASWGTLFSQPLVPGMLASLRSSEAEIVHLHEPNPLAMIMFLLSGCRSRLVIHYHSDIIRQKKLLRLYEPWLEKGLERASAIIVGSRELLEGSPILARWRSKCVVIPFGINLRPFLDLTKSEAAGDPLVLAVGRLCYYKGFHYLIEAMREVRARLVIVGEGEMRGRLVAQITSLGMEGRVKLAGRLGFDGLLDFYRRADVFCLPSCERSEAFGLVQLEAMASGLPVVSTDLPTGVRSINVHGETGLVVPRHSPAWLGYGLRQILGDENLRRKMGRNARARAVELYSREGMGRSILTLYDRLQCDDQPRPAPVGASPHGAHESSPREPVH